MRIKGIILENHGNITSIYVTHDQVEAMTLGDRLIVMDSGHAAQIGSPLEVYERPATKFVAGFIGSPAMNFIRARLDTDGSKVLLTENIDLAYANKTPAAYHGKEIVLGIRPEHFEPAEDQFGIMNLNVDHVEVLGADTLVHGHFGKDQTTLTVRLPDVHHFEKHTELPIRVPPQKLHLFDKDDGSRIGN